MLEEMCGQMGVTDSEEVQEFALFLIKGEGEYRDQDSLTCPGHCLRHRNAASVCVCGQCWHGSPVQVSWFGHCRPMSTSTM